MFFNWKTRDFFDYSVWWCLWLLLISFGNDYFIREISIERIPIGYKHIRPTDGGSVYYLYLYIYCYHIPISSTQ